MGENGNKKKMRQDYYTTTATFFLPHEGVSLFFLPHLLYYNVCTVIYSFVLFRDPHAMKRTKTMKPLKIRGKDDQ